MLIDWEGLLRRPATAKELHICRLVKERLLYEDISAEWRGKKEHIQALVYLDPLRIDFQATNYTTSAHVFVGPQLPITAELAVSEFFWKSTLEQVRESLTGFVNTA